jgi:5-methylcytosine-specific restriction endonuclease McrA
MGNRRKQYKHKKLSENEVNRQAEHEAKCKAKRSLRLFLKDIDDHHKKLRNRQKQAEYRKKFIASLHPYKRKLYSNKKWDVTFEEVLAKFGENPKCYLTGDSIDIHDTKSYHFDHIVPISRYGSGRIENMQITTAEANYAKGSMSLEEFRILCAKVANYKGGEV